MNEVPQARVERTSNRRLSLIWLVPLLALGVAMVIGVQSWWQRGPTVQITFEMADGIDPGKTRIRYRNVDVGQVTAVRISPDRNQVIVDAQMSRDAAPLVVEDTRFWVVRARVGAGSVTGLATLVSGTYIGMDIGRSTQRVERFTGLEQPPAVIASVPGRPYRLLATSLGSLRIGSPVYLRRIQVGEVTGVDLADDAASVAVQVFVRAPFDRFVSPDARFWHATGVNFAFDGGGLRVDTETIGEIIVGGVAFESPPPVPGAAAAAGSAPPAETQAAANTSFKLVSNRTEALRVQDRVVDTYRLVFEDSLHGLSVGSPVDLRGVEIGEVHSLEIEYDPKREAFRFPVTINVYPERLLSRFAPGGPRPDGMQAGAGGRDEAARVARQALVARLVQRGLRAQLRAGNLVTGQQYVALDFFPKLANLKTGAATTASAATATAISAASYPRRDAGSEPAPTALAAATPPEIPTLPGGLEQLQTSLASIATKIDGMPLEKIGRNVDTTLTGMQQTLATATRLTERIDGELAPQFKDTLTDVRRTLTGANALLSADSGVQTDTRAAMVEVRRAANALRQLATTLDEHPEALIRGKPQVSR